MWKAGSSRKKRVWVHLLIHSFSKYLMSTYYVPDAVLGPRGMEVNKREREKVPTLTERLI